MQRNHLSHGNDLPDEGAPRWSAPVMTGPLRTAWLWARHHLGAFFLFNFLVITSVLTLALAIALATYVEYVQRPRVKIVTEVYSANLAALIISVQSVPPSQRDAHIDGLSRLSGGKVAAGDPDTWGLVEPTSSLVRDFFGALREKLPAYSIAFTPPPHDGASALLWIAVPVDQGRTRWVRMDLPTSMSVPPLNLALALLLMVVITSAATAYLITATRRKLAWVAQALDGFDARTGRMSNLPPGKPDDDMLELSTRFERMSVRLFEAQAERTLLMTGVSRDLDELVHRLLQVQPRASTPAEALQCIADMQRVVLQFRDFAQADPNEQPRPLDLSPLLTELAAQASRPDAPVTLNLDGLPYTDLRPSSARRVFGNLLENAIHYGARGVELQASLDQGWIVVRVLDRGPGVSDHELALMGRPFYRTDAARAQRPGSGLGIAIARQQVEAHGGSLRLARRPGGGMQVEVWLRLSTLT